MESKYKERALKMLIDKVKGSSVGYTLELCISAIKNEK
jgi:hypothetical protein